MSWCVHLHVCFPATDNDGVADLAANASRSLSGLTPEAGWFLNDLAKRSGHNTGPKGGLCLWGVVGNRTDVEAFVEGLRPFWARLLSERLEGGPLGHERVIVFYEFEQFGAANAFEIRLEKSGLVVKHHRNLPFSWGQA